MSVSKKRKFYLSLLSVLVLGVNLCLGTVISAKDNDLSLQTAEEIVDHISHEIPKISRDGKSVILPESPNPQYEVSLYGSDNKQIIDMDLKFYQPVSDMTVNVLYKVTNKTDSTDFAVSSADIPVSVKGKYSDEEGDNPVPDVIPGLREWKGFTGDFVLSDDSNIVIDASHANTLTETAKLIQDYFKNMIGQDIAIEEGSEPHAGDIFLTLNENQQHLGEEGYTLEIKDIVTISAPDPKGINYGGISVTQILYQSSDKITLPKGIARDYPKYEVRSGMLDVGRMYIPLDYVQEITEYMAWFKLNEIQLHINDYWGSANYEAFRLESKKYPEINAKDGYYPQEEYIAYQNNVKKYGIDVVTEIDTPYHAESFRAVNPDMMLKKGALDITTPEKRALVYPFIESLFDEFLGDGPNDANRVVQSDKFHIGTDEYDKTYSEEMRHYTDHFINYVNDKGYETRLWGSLGKNGFDGNAPVSNQATMNIWAPYWSDVNEMYDAGYDIINTVGGDLYIVPVGNAGYPDYLDIRSKYDTWEVNDFWGNNRQGGRGGATMPFAHPQTKGAEFAVWNDMASFSGGLSSYDIFDRLKDAVMLVSEKTWYGEKTAGQTAEQFMERVDAVQDKTPMSNPARHIETETPIIVKYDFESVDNHTVKDLSGNGYDAQIKGGEIVEGRDGNALQLDGNSYLELPLAGLGYPYSVSFDIQLDEGSLDDAKLFSGKDGSLYLDMNQTGKLGYQRNEETSEDSLTKFENYTFTHDYVLKENEWHNVVLIGDNKETTLYVNGKRVSTSKQTNKLEGRVNDSSTFVLPLEVIGKGVKGKIDNITVMNQGLNNSLQKNLAYQQNVTASSEYNSAQRASFITDGDYSTRWGSQYKNISEEEKDNQWFKVELDQAYKLNEVKLHWETARAKNYKVLVSNDGNTFKEVYTHTYDSKDGLLDTISLDGVEAKFLKVVMTERATQYGYSLYELEVFGEVDFDSAEKLIDEAEQLLDNVSAEESGEKERAELIAAKDEMKTFLSGEDEDVFIFDMLSGKLIDKIAQFKQSVVIPVNLAYQQRVTASSVYNDSQKASYITDGDLSTRWGSQYKNISEEEKDNQWIMVELDQPHEVDTLKIHWETARAEEYKILASQDGETFNEVYVHTHEPENGLTDMIDLQQIKAKFIKVMLSKRATEYGYSIYELEAYNFSSAKELLENAALLLDRIPEEVSGENERAELTTCMNELKTYLSGQDIGFEYHILTKELTTKIAQFKQSIAFSAADMKTLVEDFEDEGEIANSNAARTLKVHLTAVGQYEKEGLADKLVKHMESFKLLLEHQKDTKLLSEKAYDALMSGTSVLIGKWK